VGRFAAQVRLGARNSAIAQKISHLIKKRIVTIIMKFSLSAVLFLLPAVLALDAPKPATSAVALPAKPVLDVTAVPLPASKCASTNASYQKTRDAFNALKDTNLYVFGSIVNAEPNHSDLLKAASYMLDTIPPILAEAKQLNDQDTAWGRKNFIKSKIGFLKAETSIARKFITDNGQLIPSLPIVGKAIAWAQAIWPRANDLYKSIVNGPPGPNDPVFEPSKNTLDPQKIVEYIAGKLLDIDQEMYNLVAQECRLQ
jgi:hypothetical protein